ncbi:hypothetical protein ACLOJK_015958 [Asimina triloba]
MTVGIFWITTTSSWTTTHRLISTGAATDVKYAVDNTHTRAKFKQDYSLKEDP